MFKVFETFLNGQTVFRYVSKRVRNSLKQGSPGGQPGFTRGSARGQQGVIGIFSYDQKVIMRYKRVNICYVDN